MKSSIVGDDWIRQTQMAVPIQKVMKPDAAGVPQWTGDLLSGPVRLSFVNLMSPAPPMKGQVKAPGTPDTYNSVLLFPPPLPGQNVQQQMALLYEEYYRVAAKDFADHWNGQQYVGLHSPFHDQGEKFKYDGYTTGSIYITMGSRFKPNIVTPIPGDPDHFNPVTDVSKVYPGVWAVVAFNCYAGGKGRPVKGPMFGIQTVMLIADDSNLGGGSAADPKASFGGVVGAIPTAITRPNLSALPGGGGMPPAPGQMPPPAMPGYPTTTPSMPVQPSYSPAPPPPSPPGGDDWDFMK